MANTTPKAVRQFVVSLLDDGTIVTAGEVFDSRTPSFADGDRDLKLAVFTDSGDTDNRSIQKFRGQRTIRLRVETHAEADPATDGATLKLRDAALQAKIDDADELVRAKVLESQAFWLLACKMRRAERQSGRDVESAQLHGIVHTTFHLEVDENYTPSLAAAVDLETVRVETDMIAPGDGPDTDIDSTILVTVPT